MLRLPFGTPEFIDRIVTGGVNQVGRRTLRMLITTWDAAGGGPFAASAVASTGMAKTAEIVQNMFVGPVFGPLRPPAHPQRLGPAYFEPRTPLAGSPGPLGPRRQ